MDTIERTTAEVHAVGYPKEITIAIAQIMGSDLYVQKRGKNAFHGYKYATVGDLLDKLQPLIAEAGLVIIQDEISTEFIDAGNVMATRYHFTLAHISGAVWPDRPTLTGMTACRNSKGGFDDKAANKCHTAARKYFLLGLFQVPTGEDFREKVHVDDADGHGDAPLPHADAEDPFADDKPVPNAKSARAVTKAHAGRFELLFPNGELLAKFDTPLAWCEGLRDAIKQDGAQVLGLWEMNLPLANSIPDRFPELQWDIKGKHYHPIGVIESMVRKLTPGIST